MQAFYPLLAALAAYAVGSLSFAVLVSRFMGLNDPRTYGSKSPGATNVLRSGSKPAAVLTLLLDAAKGWLPLALVAWYGKPYGLEEGSMALVGLAAFLGHLFPLFFRFQGGKGAATGLGVLFGVNWMLGLATVATWLIIAWFFRYSSLASLWRRYSRRSITCLVTGWPGTAKRASRWPWWSWACCWFGATRQTSAV